MNYLIILLSLNQTTLESDETLSCINCNKSSVHYVPYSEINVYPSNSKSPESLINDTMMSTLLKGSDCSSENTDHSDIC